MRGQLHPNIQEVLTLEDFIEHAQNDDFGAVIWHRWKNKTPANKARIAVRNELEQYWKKWNSPTQFSLLSQKEIRTTRYEEPIGQDFELNSTPALSKEFNSMVQAFESITGISHTRLTVVPNSNNPMPSQKVRKEPVILCEWFSNNNGYILDPDKRAVNVQSGNWIFLKPWMVMDIKDKNFRLKPTKRLAVILEPAPDLLP